MEALNVQLEGRESGKGRAMKTCHRGTQSMQHSCIGSNCRSLILLLDYNVGLSFVTEA